MNTQYKAMTISVIVFSLPLSSRGSGQLFGPTVTPSPTITNTPTLTPTADPGAHLRKYEGEIAFSFIDGSEPGMPIRDGGIGPSYKLQPGDSREQIVIDETFSVPAGEEVIFEDKIVWIRPKQERIIEVYGTLIVKNSLLLWDQMHNNQALLHIKNGGALNIESSYAFSANQYRVNWSYNDGATVLFDHYMGDPWTVISGSVNYTAINFSSVYVTLHSDIHDTIIQISDAHLLYFEIKPPPGEFDITFPEKFDWVDWTLSDLWPDTTVEVEHSYLFERDITLYPGAHVTIRDVPSGLGFGWDIHKFSEGIVECELRGMGDPDHESVFYEHQTWDLPCIDSSLTLINSRIQKAWPYSMGNIHLRIFNSNLIDPRAFQNPAITEIYDSTLENVAAYDGARIYLENVRIIHDLEVIGANSVIYGYGVSPWEIGWEFEIMKVDGGQYIELDSPGPPWE